MGVVVSANVLREARSAVANGSGHGTIISHSEGSLTAGVIFPPNPPSFARQRVALDGMKKHALVQATLPCGWTDYLLFHRQASLQAMNPEEPFYLPDEGGQQIPPLFYPMLNKSMLEAWLAYLWARGREQGQRARLVVLLNGGAGQGDAAWRGVVQAGLSRRTPSNLESQQ